MIWCFAAREWSGKREIKTKTKIKKAIRIRIKIKIKITSVYTNRVDYLSLFLANQASY